MPETVSAWWVSQEPPDTEKPPHCKEYYRSEKNTYLVTCGKSMTAKQLLQHLLREMGIAFHGTIHEIIERITLELNKQHDPLLIIDEAGKLSQLVMEYLHDLQNATEHNCGMVMAGVGYFKDNLKKASDNNKEGMPEKKVCLN